MKPEQPLQNGNIRLAATVVLLREQAGEMQVYMVERPMGAVFPNLHVFPGGKVDAADDIAECCDGLTAAAAAAQLGVVGAQRFWVTAVRECFEECGVLLLRRGEQLVDAGTQEALEPWRQRLIDGETTMRALCSQHELRVACDELFYFSHWLTPESAPKRFDTRFFVAALPAQQQTSAHHYEVVDDSWVSPSRALQRAASGEWQLIAPTQVTLESLARYDNIAMLRAAIQRNEHLPALTPELRREGMCDLRG